MKRIFIALDISEEARSVAVRHIEALRNNVSPGAATWVRPEKMHLTVRFVGDCDPSMLDRICEVSARCAGETRPFKLSLSKPGVFPEARNPRTLWIGIQDQGGALPTLASCVRPPDERSGSTDKIERFTPHLTIGRVKDIRRCRQVVEQHLNHAITPVVFVVAGLTVYESKLLPKGSVYRVVSRHPFKESDP